MCQSYQGTGVTRGWRILCEHTLVCGLHVGIGAQLLPEAAASDEFLNPSLKKPTTLQELKQGFITQPDQITRVCESQHTLEKCLKGLCQNIFTLIGVNW